MALAYKSGTAGAVRSGSNVAIAGLTKWSIDKQLQMIATPSFSLTADANGVMWNQFVLTGLASATADIAGHYNTGDGTEVILYIGAVLVLDLLFDKTTPYGYLDLAATVMSVQAGTDIEANKAASFSAKVQLTGSIVVPS